MAGIERETRRRKTIELVGPRGTRGNYLRNGSVAWAPARGQYEALEASDLILGKILAVITQMMGFVPGLIPRTVAPVRTALLIVPRAKWP